MDVEHVTLREGIEKAESFIRDTLTLAKLDNALQVLPQDTTFAIVIEAVERGLAESFTEMDVSGASFRVSNTGGIRGSFVGYLCLSASMCRVYNNAGQLVAAQPIAQVQIDYGLNIVTVGDKRFRINNATPIADAAGHFESNASGFYNGLAPLYKLLEAGGASGNKQAAKRNSTVFMIVFVVLFIGLTIVIMTHSKK